MDSLLQDLRHGLRSLAKQPGFALVSVLSLAIGIGVNTAIFSALNALLLRPLAVRDLDRTVYVYHADPAHPDRGTSFPAFQQYRDRRDTFSAVAAFSGERALVLTDRERRDHVYAEIVTADFFAIADADMHLGRPFDRDVERTVNPPLVTVLGHRLWQRRFGSDPAIVGKTVELNGEAFRVVGVAGPHFTGLARVSADLWIPMTTWAHVAGEPARLTSDEHWITTLALLNDGVTLEQAAAAMAAMGGPQIQVKVRSIRRRSMEAPVEVLAVGGGAFAVGLLVLLLACTNVTNLLMARVAARQHEMSVRLALGSSRVRLMRLWLTETSLLSLAAGIGGLFVASWLLALIVGFELPTPIGQVAEPALPLEFSLDASVFAFTFGLSALTSLFVGLLTGLHLSRQGAMRVIKNARMTDRRFAPGFNLRSTVIALQMALSMLLLIPCGLFVRSWLNASTMAPGFSAENVLLLPISANQTGIRVKTPPGFELQLAERVAKSAGVEAATVMDPVPLWFGGSFAHFSIEGDHGPGALQRMGFARVAPGYFETLRIPLVAGRDFSASDASSAPWVAIINETMARRLWPDRSAIGQRVRGLDHVIEVVGIARDAKYLSLAERAQPWVYVPLAQASSNNTTLSLAVRATGDPMRLRTAIEREMKALVPAWPAFQFRTLDESLQVQQLLPRLGATLLGVLGAFGLLLAAMGTYGVMAYVVRQRAHEIAIRLALGSPTVRVLALIIKQGMVVCVVGATAGLGMALVAAQLLGSVLFGVGALDPLTYVAVPALLLGVAFLACYVPARQITKTNAVEVLRQE